MPKPKAVVFDLDGCVWRPEMYELWGGGAPFKDNGDNYIGQVWLRLLYASVRAISSHGLRR